MRRVRFIISSLAFSAFGVLVGCAGDGAAAGPRTKVGLPGPGAASDRVLWKPPPAASYARGKGQPWTILCVELAGPFAEKHVETWAAQLKKIAGIRPKNVYYEQGSDGYWRLYYGTYYRRSRTDGGLELPEDLKGDLAMIRAVRSTEGQGLFLYAMKVPKPQPCDERPEWLLSRVDAKYSLQVAVFLPSDELQNHKQAAVDYCTFLREKGLEAYYHHSSASSAVTVGAFGKEAVRSGVREFPKVGERGPGREYVSEYGPQVEALRRKDELLQYNLVNGQIHRVQPLDQRGRPVAGSKPIAMGSMLVEIPREQSEGDAMGLSDE